MSGLGALFSPGMLQGGIALADMGMTGINQTLSQILNLANLNEAKGIIGQNRGLVGEGSDNTLTGAHRTLLKNLQKNQPLDRADYGSMQNDILGRMQGETDRSVGAARGLRDRASAEAYGLAGNIGGMMDERARRNLAYLEGSGNQERKDINQQFTSANAANQANLASRGLANTTIGSQLSSGNERNRSDALGGLEERLRQQRISTDAGLTGEAINTRSMLGQRAQDTNWGMEQNVQNTANQGMANYLNQFNALRGGQYDMDVGQRDRLMNTRFNNSINLLDAEQGNNNQLLSLLSGLQINGPDMGAFSQRMQNAGQAMAPSYKPPGTDWVSPSIGAGAGVAGSIITTKMFVPVCLDGDSMIETPDGSFPLVMIREGDMVLCEDGQYHRVLFNDFGASFKQRSEEWVTITTETGRSITATMDHVIEDRPAGEWRPPQYIGVERVHSIHQAKMPEISADLLIEGNHNYIANGFAITSKMSEVVAEVVGTCRS